MWLKCIQAICRVSTGEAVAGELLFRVWLFMSRVDLRAAGGGGGGGGEGGQRGGGEGWQNFVIPRLIVHVQSGFEAAGSGNILLNIIHEL